MYIYAYQVDTSIQKNTKNKNNLFDTVRKLKLMPSKISHEIDDNAIENLKSRRN